MSGFGDDDGYAVGKGRPPVASRFKPGQSGNPKGRPKGRKNFATELEEVLGALVSITENGRSRKVTSRQAALLKLRQKALAGDGRAMDRLLELARQHAEDQAAGAAERSLSAAEDDILHRYIQSQTGERQEDTGVDCDATGGRGDDSD